MQKYLKISEVCTRYNVAHSTIYRLMDRGQFPRPTMKFGNDNRWSVEMLDKWDKEQAAAA